MECPPIIIFCYEQTRGTEHLRCFFREFLGYITCDASAKANRMNVLIYLQYLFDQIPQRQARGEKEFMADMMPWSEAYKGYEERKQQERRSLYGELFPKPERPRTPRKRKRTEEMEQTA